MPKLPKIFHLQFAPETWTPLYRLCNFVGQALPNKRDACNGLTACQEHLNKLQVLKRILQRLAPELKKDREELDKYGASRSLNSQEFAAVWETTICELYASLDGLRQFLFGHYKGIRKVQNDSNEKLFKRAHGKEYGSEFSEQIRSQLAQAYEGWFPKLRKLRTELTHGKVGSCYLDCNTGKIRYINDGLGNLMKAFVLEDVLAVLSGYEIPVRDMLNAIAEIILVELAEIEKKPHFQICGYYLGRIYARAVSPSPKLTSQDGQCLSWDWFEQDKEHFCPLASRCLAYNSKWPGGSKAFLGNKSE